MKIFNCLFVTFIYMVLADNKNVKRSESFAIEKSSDSKTKRDASLLSGVYHGPSYKYLPPTSFSSSYGSYPANTAQFSGGYIPHFGPTVVGYNSVGAGRVHSHHGNHNSASFHAFPYAPTPSYTHSGGYPGPGFTSSNHYVGRESIKHTGTNFIAGTDVGAGSHIASIGHGDFSVSRPNSYNIGHGYDSSSSSVPNVGYKSQYPKGVDGPYSSPASTGFGTVHGLSSSSGSALDENHVHNGVQENIFVVSQRPAGFNNLHDAVSLDKHRSPVVPIASYLPPAKQHPHPSSSYGDQISTVGGSYNTHYNPQPTEVLEHRPAYAGDHKGLGYFSFTSNRPKVLHTSLSGSSLKQPSYAKPPFKPSIFLGAKFESPEYNDIPGQQHSPLLEVGNDSTGYDYNIPSRPSTNYQEPSYQQSVELQQNTVHEPDTSYLPPSNSYGDPYSH